MAPNRPPDWYHICAGPSTEATTIFMFCRNAGILFFVACRPSGSQLPSPLDFFHLSRILGLPLFPPLHGVLRKASCTGSSSRSWIPSCGKSPTQGAGWLVSNCYGPSAWGCRSSACAGRARCSRNSCTNHSQWHNPNVWSSHIPAAHAQAKAALQRPLCAGTARKRGSGSSLPTASRSSWTSPRSPPWTSRPPWWPSWTSPRSPPWTWRSPPWTWRSPPWTWRSPPWTWLSPPWTWRSPPWTWRSPPWTWWSPPSDLMVSCWDLIKAFVAALAFLGGHPTHCS